MKNKLPGTVPKWLMNLPPGTYTCNEISKLTKTTPGNVYIRFDALGVQKSITKVSNKWVNTYEWQGAEYYIKKDFEDKIRGIGNG